MKLGKSVIDFNGEQSVVFLRSSKDMRQSKHYLLRISIFNNSSFYVGLNTTINSHKNSATKKELMVLVSEQKHIFIGNDVMFSFDIILRTSDTHLVYSLKNSERKNPAKSIFIGDHVWIGQNAALLKGTQIASGSIIGAYSVVAGKKIASNTSWVGNPSKLVSTDVFWTRHNSSSFKNEDTEHYNKYLNPEQFIFKYEPAVYLPFDKIDEHLTKCKTADNKLKYLIKISSIDSHNRFAF